MIQRRVEEQLHEYLQGTLDETSQREVETLLANNAEAQALFNQMREAHGALKTLRERPTPEAPLDTIQLAITQRTGASAVFAGRPEPDMHAWGNRFYKRVAAAAVLLCGLSLGVAVHTSLSNGLSDGSTDAAESSSSDRSPDDAKRTPGERNVDVTGEITAFDLMNRNKGNLVTFTPTDSVEPTYEFSGVREPR
jgi:anti-sigma factor RsiW